MSDKNSKNQNYYLSFGIGFGLLGGTIFSTIVGMFFKFPLIWALGPGLGMLIGIDIGVMMDKNIKTIKKDVIKIILVSIMGTILILLVPIIIGYLQ